MNKEERRGREGGEERARERGKRREAAGGGGETNKISLTSTVHLLANEVGGASIPTSLGGGSLSAIFVTKGSLPAWQAAISRRAMNRPCLSR